MKRRLATLYMQSRGMTLLSSFLCICHGLNLAVGCSSVYKCTVIFTSRHRVCDTLCHPYRNLQRHIARFSLRQHGFLVSYRIVSCKLMCTQPRTKIQNATTFIIMQTTTLNELKQQRKIGQIIIRINKSSLAMQAYCRAYIKHTTHAGKITKKITQPLTKITQILEYKLGYFVFKNYMCIITKQAQMSSNKIALNIVFHL